MSNRGYGCVANFPPDNPLCAVWRHGNYFTIQEFGIGGATLPLQSDPAFQALAQEMHRLATEVGRLRRVEIEHDREARRALAE